MMIGVHFGSISMCFGTSNAPKSLLKFPKFRFSKRLDQIDCRLDWRIGVPEAHVCDLKRFVSSFTVGDAEMKFRVVPLRLKETVIWGFFSFQRSGVWYDPKSISRSHASGAPPPSQNTVFGRPCGAPKKINIFHSCARISISTKFSQILLISTNFRGYPPHP